MSDKAKKLIAENRLAKAPFLDLSGCDITEIPEDLGDFLWIKSLYLNNTQVADLSPLKNLSALNTLNCLNTRVADLSPLKNLTALQTLTCSNTQVADLSPLKNLTALQYLTCSNTQVNDLSPLSDLYALRDLDFSSTQVSGFSPLKPLRALQRLICANTEVGDLSPLESHSALRYLDCSRTQVTDLSALKSAPELDTLYFSNTQITDLSPLSGSSRLKNLWFYSTPVEDLSPLSKLPALHTLYFSQTKVANLAPLKALQSLRVVYCCMAPVADLSPLIALIRQGIPVEWNERALKGDGIYVGGCPVTNPPAEIVAHGNEAILNYFAEREASAVDHLFEAKMLILGEGGAGKTTLVRRLYQPELELPTEKDTTRGIEIHKHEFKLKSGRTFRLNVWDFGGQQIYHATHQFFLTQRSLYVLLDDTRKDYKSVSDEGFRYWLELIEVFGGHSPTLIFQNEKDGRSKAIDLPGIKHQYDNVKERYAGNLEYRDAADKLREAIEFFAAHLSHIGEELPASWIKVRADVEVISHVHPYVPVEEYFRIYGGHLEFDREKALHLSRYLHDLGVFLHFQDDPLLRRTVILQNEWATTAVFRVIDDEIVKGKLGRFGQDDCARLWQGTGYDNMHLELLALMQNFELCYRLAESDPPTWLAPQLLPPTKPQKLLNWSLPGDLVLRYKYDFLPKGMISRLTVRKHRFVRSPGLSWVTGVLFEQDNTVVLVEVLPSGDEIELRARGPENNALLSVISADLDALNDSFKGLREKVDKRIPCNCEPCRNAKVPWFFGHKELVRRKEYGKLKVECPNSFESVDVLELLDGIKIEPPPDWAKAPRVESQRPIRIFLASSQELRIDRDAFDLYIRQQNDQLRKQGLYLEVVRWEHFLDAMSETRLQDEYNEAVRNCDVFVSLFFTKTGKFTEEEFDVAHRQFKKSGIPLIYTFFKTAEVNIDELPKDDFNSLRNFQDRLKVLGHYYTRYKNLEDLKLQFRDQIAKIREKLTPSAG